jgi:DeoR/GlpR family transcriptional regulator of sugar metabolism
VARATKRVLGQTRQQELLHYLQTFRSGHVAELSELLGASASTIRRDLDSLQDQGLVERVHGGAAITDIAGEPAPPVRAVTHALEKARIGEAAAALVDEGDTVLVTGGTTTEAMVTFLGARHHLTVVTNALNVAMALSKFTGIDLVVLGGVLRRDEMSLLGHLTVSALAEFQIDKAFTGAFGLDAATGLSGMNLGETQTDRALIGGAARLVVLADGSKLSQRGPVRLAPLTAISTLVTDSSADPASLDRIRAQGIEVIVC